MSGGDKNVHLAIRVRASAITICTHAMLHIYAKPNQIVYDNKTLQNVTTVRGGETNKQRCEQAQSDRNGVCWPHRSDQSMRGYFPNNNNMFPHMTPHIYNRWVLHACVHVNLLYIVSRQRGSAR